jgi:hypothetical protein
MRSSVARSGAPTRRHTDYRIYLSRDADPQGGNTVEGMVQDAHTPWVERNRMGIFAALHVAELWRMYLT